jgi:hypothetical protein
MTKEQKAVAWYQSKGFTAGTTVFGVYVEVWNEKLDECIDVYVDDLEVSLRANSWDKEQQHETTNR